MAETIELLSIDYADVVQSPSKENPNVAAKLSDAFGSKGVPMIVMKNIPGFEEMKNQLLPRAHGLAHLPKEYLMSELTSEESGLNAGWSVAKTSTGKPTEDAHKGGFYFNPLTDDPGKSNLAFYPKNKWPSEEKMPGFPEAAKELGTVMHETLNQLARHIDAFVGTKHSAAASLHDAVSESGKAKCRLLYYYPTDGATENDDGYWNGWHVDTGYLTGHAGDLYINDADGAAVAGGAGDVAGLYTVAFDGAEHKVEVPPGCMGVQFGGCLQVLAGGAIRATPHCVRGPGKGCVGRAAMVCFVDAGADFVLAPPRGVSVDEALAESIPSKAPPLAPEIYGEDGVSYGVIHAGYENY